MKVMNGSSRVGTMLSESFTSAASDEKSSSLSYSVSHLVDFSPPVATIDAITSPVHHNNDTNNCNRNPAPIVKTTATGTAATPMLSTPVTTPTATLTRNWISIDTPTQRTTTNNLLQDLNSTMNTEEEENNNNEIRNISDFYSSPCLINNEKINGTGGTRVCISANIACSESDNNKDIEENKRNNAATGSISNRKKINSIIDRWLGSDRSDEDNVDDFGLVSTTTMTDAQIEARDQSCSSGICATSYDDETNQIGLTLQMRLKDRRQRRRLRQRRKVCCYVLIALFLLMALVAVPLVTLYFLVATVSSSPEEDSAIFNATSLTGNSSKAIKPKTTSLAQDIADILNENIGNDENVNNDHGEEPHSDIIETPIDVHKPLIATIAPILANGTINPRNIIFEDMNVTAEKFNNHSYTIVYNNVTLEVSNETNVTETNATNTINSITNGTNSTGNEVFINSKLENGNGHNNNYVTSKDIYSDITIANNSIGNKNTTNVTEVVYNDNSVKQELQEAAENHIVKNTIHLHNTTTIVFTNASTVATSTNVTGTDKNDLR